MSTSILYHTFGIRSVQYISSDFLVAKQLSMAGFTLTTWFAQNAKAVM